jgi:hypothetical protein
LQQAAKVPGVQGHTAGGGTEARARDVDENRAAAAGNARPGIMIELDNEVVEMIRPPKSVAGTAFRQQYGPVVPSIQRIFTPAVILPDTPDRKQRFRTDGAVGPPPEPPGPKPAARGSAVPLVFIGPDSRAAESNRHPACPGNKPSLRAEPSARPNVNGGMGNFSHALCR